MSSPNQPNRTKEEEFLLDSEYMKSRMLLNKLFGPKAAALLENTPGSSNQSESSRPTQNSGSPKETIEFDPLDPIDKRKCREVKYPEFQYATNANGEARQRLFVFEQHSRTQIREYAKYVRGRWYCLGCRSQPFRKSNQGRMEGSKFYAPLDHYCKPVSYAEALVKQQKIKLKMSENSNAISNGNPSVLENILFAGGNNNQKLTVNTQKSAPLNSSASMTAMTIGFREVPDNEYFYGYNADGTPNMRLIVYEPDDRNALREYGYTTSKWYCLGCSRITKTRNFAGFENGILKCPVAHLCQPYSKKEVDDRQQLFEKRKGAQKRGPKGPTKSPAAKRAAVFSSHERQSDDDPIEFLGISRVSRYGISSPSNTTFDSRKSSHDLTSDPDDAILGSSNITEKIEILEHQPPETPSVISLPSFNLDGYNNINNNNSPTLSDQLFQIAFSYPSPITTTFSFNNPSKLWLKSACENLQIPYNHEAYQLWATIDIDEIQSTSKPDKIKEVKSGEDSGFRAISLLLTGKEDAKIKIAVNKWFYKNFNKLGKCLGMDFTNFDHHKSVVFDTLFASEMTPFHCEALCHILECRVGVYENEKLVKYGNWETDDGKVTLLLELKNKCFNVVTSLHNN